MHTFEAAHAKVREICLSLPDTKETPTWGKPHFRVGEKIFAGLHDEGPKSILGFKLSKARQAAMLRDKRFTKAPYVGHAGWVSMDLSDVRDWEEVRALVLESYRAIAAKKSLAKLTGATKVIVAPRATSTTRRLSRPRTSASRVSRAKP